MPIDKLPPETFLHILAFLPAPSLNAASLVCRRWNEVIKDDTAWREAFVVNYGIKSDSSHEFTLGRRLESTSWKVEYITRTRLLQ